MDFVAIDVETANSDMASICQIGIACYQAGTLVEEWVSYIDPEDFFDEINISIHGITESKVRRSPKLPGVAKTLYKLLDHKIVVCHTHFDRVAISKAFDKYGIHHPKSTWLDSARVARRTWEEFAWFGYGLYNICEYLKYDFSHHNALEDAKAAGHIMLMAMNYSGLNLQQWIKRVNQPIDPSLSRRIKCEGNPEGSLYGEILVFTGALKISRREAAEMAAQIGCQVESGVNKKTTILVVGDQDIRKLAGHDKSSKHRKAEELIFKGYPIRIICETDFKALANFSG